MCSHNSRLINGLLKDELGLQGFVVTDWLGQASGVGSALAGLDMNMLGDAWLLLAGASRWMGELARAVLNGSVPTARLNDMATSVVAAWFRMGQHAGFPPTNFDTNTRRRHGLLFPGAWPDSPVGLVNHMVPAEADHADVARAVARDSVTLLKNDGGLLPLPPRPRLRVFGSGVRADPAGPNACSYCACNRGTLGQGWGSGTVDYPRLDDPVSALRARAPDLVLHDADVFPPGAPDPGPDDAVVFVSADAGEGTHVVEGNHGDRDAAGLALWHRGDDLVRAAARRFRRVVVVVHTVGPVLVDAWIDLPAVGAVVVTHLPGQEAGRSLADVLFGDVSPSGHLPYSMTRREDDLPPSLTRLVGWAGPGRRPQDTFSEGLLIDYRFLNRHGIKPRFAFGHGLSYTTFAYANASVARPTPPPRPPKRGVLDYAQPPPPPAEAVAPAGFRLRWRYLYPWLTRPAAEAAARDALRRRYPYPDGYSTEQRPGPRAGGGPGGNPALWDVAYRLSVRVTNTGSHRVSKASVQAYVQFPPATGYDTPVIQLRDFEKTAELAPGESATVELRLTRKDLSVWDVRLQDWVVPAVDGAYRVWLGAASDDLTTVCRLEDLVCGHGVQGPV